MSRFDKHELETIIIECVGHSLGGALAILASLASRVTNNII